MERLWSSHLLSHFLLHHHHHHHLLLLLICFVQKIPISSVPLMETSKAEGKRRMKEVLRKEEEAEAAVAATTTTTEDIHLGEEYSKRRRALTQTLSEKKPNSDSVVTGGPGPGPGPIQRPCCQVEGCRADLKDAKQYHRRHKVCEDHSKAPLVLVAGVRQRFCQQCSRFHDLSEFDEAKRSCRRRLAGHNERRRKSSYESNGDG